MSRSSNRGQGLKVDQSDHNIKLQAHNKIHRGDKLPTSLSISQGREACVRREPEDLLHSRLPSKTTNTSRWTYRKTRRWWALEIILETLELQSMMHQGRRMQTRGMTTELTSDLLSSAQSVQLSMEFTRSKTKSLRTTTCLMALSSTKIKQRHQYWLEMNKGVLCLEIKLEPFQLPAQLELLTSHLLSTSRLTSRLQCTVTLTSISLRLWGRVSPSFRVRTYSGLCKRKALK